jgi:hypothetical protein
MFGRKKPTAEEVRASTLAAVEGTEAAPEAKGSELQGNAEVLTAEHEITHDDAARINQHLEGDYLEAGDVVVCTLGEHARRWFRVKEGVVLELGRA